MITELSFIRQVFSMLRQNKGYIIKMNNQIEIFNFVLQNLSKEAFVPGSYMSVNELQTKNPDLQTLYSYTEVYDCSVRICESFPYVIREIMLPYIIRTIATHPKYSGFGYPINYSVLKLVDHNLLQAIITCNDKDISYFIEMIWNSWTTYWACWIHPDLQLPLAESIRETALYWKKPRTSNPLINRHIY